MANPYHEKEITVRTDPNFPACHFRYTYHFNFQTIAAAFLRNFNYERRAALTSIFGVQQLDEDRI